MTLKLQKNWNSNQQAMAESIPYCQFLLHFTLLLLAIAMLGQGLAFQDECKNGTSDFLVFGGAFVLALSVVSLGFCALSPSSWFWIWTMLSLGLLFLVMTIWVRSVIHWAVMQHVWNYLFFCIFRGRLWFWKDLVIGPLPLRMLRNITLLTFKLFAQSNPSTLPMVFLFSSR